MTTISSLLLPLLFLAGGNAGPVQNYPGQVGTSQIIMNSGKVRLTIILPPNHPVFLGDSITHFWVQNGAQLWSQYYEPLGSINTGWPGDWSFDVINKINTGLIDNYNPRLVVLLIGTNDLGGDGTETSVHSNVGTVIDLVQARNPGVKVLLLGILPRVGVAVHQKIRNANTLLATYGDNESIFYLDMESWFSNGLGSLLPGMSEDGVHLSQLGYLTWTQAMNPLFFAILDGDQVTTQVPISTGPPPTGSTLSTTTGAPPSGKASKFVTFLRHSQRFIAIFPVFIGDSITQFWGNDGLATWNQYYASIGAVNFGVSGDWTDNTISRIVVDGMINGQNADLAVLKIGTNDLSQDTPAQRVADNIQTIINLIKETNPVAKILLLGILPRGDGWDGINHQRVKNVNAIIRVSRKCKKYSHILQACILPELRESGRRDISGYGQRFLL